MINNEQKDQYVNLPRQPLWDYWPNVENDKFIYSWTPTKNGDSKRYRVANPLELIDISGAVSVQTGWARWKQWKQWKQWTNFPLLGRHNGQ